MQLIRCTQKLQKEMGLKKADLITQEVAEQPTKNKLGSWHANLLFIDRRKCVLFVNDKTLFNFIVPDLNREQLRQLDIVFRSFLSCVLAEESFEEIIRDQIMKEYESIGFAATNNRSVMGSMNDLAFNYKYQIQTASGVHSSQVPQIIHQLNRMPMGALGYEFSINAVRALFGLQKTH